MRQSRHVVITGACGGIGKAIAQRFRDESWSVTGIDLNVDRSSGVFDRLIQVDISTADGLRAAVTQIDEPIGSLVNNAAVQVNSALADTTDEQWNLTLETNLGAPFRLIRELRDRLVEGSGAIVNIGSVHAYATSENVAAYAISKGALAQLTRSAALELASAGIRCNSVAPGAVLTPMLTDGLSRRPHPDGSDGNLNNLIQRTPLGFVATPAQIAPTVFHLADNEQTSYMTGQVVVIDGGATLRLGTE